MRHDVAFTSGGLTCRGWFYEPENSTGDAPAIVMSHGFAAVKEQGLGEFAAAFASAGFAVLVFDYRYLGTSDGAERGRIIAQEQHDDLRAALAFLSAHRAVDANRIGIWGASFSGGHSLFLGALDPRVKAVVAMVPALDNAHSIIATGGRDRLLALLPRLAAEHAMRNHSGAASPRVPVVAPDDQPCVFPTPDSYAWFMNSRATAPNWLDSTTAESIARMLEYQPIGFVDLIAPKPLLILAGLKDALIPIEQVRSAFARAGEPKKLVEFDGGHYDFFPGGRFHDQAASEAIDWFRAALSQ
jgi:uncharacterized protein